MHIEHPLHAITHVSAEFMQVDAELPTSYTSNEAPRIRSSVMPYVVDLQATLVARWPSALGRRTRHVSATLLVCLRAISPLLLLAALRSAEHVSQSSALQWKPIRYAASAARYIRGSTRVYQHHPSLF